jgi:DNA-binding transcriptional ArsR family regulator
MKKNNHIKEKQDHVFLSIARILGGLSAPVRVRLIHFLSQSPLTVEVLSKKIDQSIANTSMHLRKMLSENLVTAEVVGQKRLYSLHPSILLFWEQIQDFVQSLEPELNLKVDELNWLESEEVTINLIKEGKVTLLDVRPKDETSQNLELENCLHIPSSEIQDSIQLLPKRKPILVICRGRFCVLSVNVVTELRSLGFKAFRLEYSAFQLKLKLDRGDKND